MTMYALSLIKFPDFHRALWVHWFFSFEERERLVLARNLLVLQVTCNASFALILTVSYFYFPFFSLSPFSDSQFPWIVRSFFRQNLYSVFISGVRSLQKEMGCFFRRESDGTSKKLQSLTTKRTRRIKRCRRPKFFVTRSIYLLWN